MELIGNELLKKDVECIDEIPVIADIKEMELFALVIGYPDHVIECNENKISPSSVYDYRSNENTLVIIEIYGVIL